MVYNLETTLVLLKPDAVQRGLMGTIISRFENTGLKIVGAKMVYVSKELAEKHYKDDLILIVGNKTKKDWDAAGMKYSETAEELGKMIIDGTRRFLRSAPVLALVLEGLYAVEIVRKLVGSTGPKDSAPGTIRGDFAHLSLGYASAQRKGAANLIHASGNVEEAKQEVALWFKPEELHSYKTVHETHVF